ncbi:MAG: redox-sensing transcriptional repressor Rex [Caldithrix sp.]|nr:redox-sensing transcriptional repressor Rex [Caldithrix sp.]
MKNNRMSRRMISAKTIERLVLYKRLLKHMAAEGKRHIFSHELAALVNNSPAQVRRDLMQMGYTSRSAKGYEVLSLIDEIHQILASGRKQNMVLAGVGNLGRALLSYFSYRQPALEIVAAFDSDRNKIDRVIGGCRCYHVEDMIDKIGTFKATIGIITVPAERAQQVADSMVEGGVRAILNFAPVPVQLPKGVLREQMDITMQLEKLAYLVKQGMEL